MTISEALAQAIATFPGTTLMLLTILVVLVLLGLLETVDKALRWRRR